jgi:hypothetical protein
MNWKPNSTRLREGGNVAEMTGAEAGIGANQQLRIALGTMVAHGGTASIKDIYTAVEAVMQPDTLSKQGRDSLRSFISRDCVGAGFVLHHDKNNPGWHITPEGREFLKSDDAQAAETEEVTNAEGNEVTVPSIAVKAVAFEKYVLSFMTATYPEHAWYHQGVHKKHERGLDLVGTRLRPEPGQPRVVGVQVKLHATDNAPGDVEWLKFLAGCYARRVDLGIFVTTGRLTGQQRREAAEAQVAVIDGYDELTRLSKRAGLAAFDLGVPQQEAAD